MKQTLSNSRKLLPFLATAILATAGGELTTHAQWFSPTSFWRTKTVGEALAADQSDGNGVNGKLYLQYLYYSNGTARAAGNRTNFGFTNHVWTAPAGQATITVTDSDDNFMTSKWGPVPWLTNATPNNGPDHHCVIWQPSTNKMWEFWEAYVTSTSPLTVKARHGAFLANVTNHAGVSPTPYGATATGFPLVGGMVTREEARQITLNPNSTANLIPHVLCMALPEIADFHVAPATRHDSPPQGGPHAIPEGRRFRLPANVAIPTNPPLLRAIVIAARDYGIIVRDGTGNGAIIQLYGERNKPGDTDYWRACLLQPAEPAPWSASWTYQTYSFLNAFPWDKLQVLNPVTGTGLVNGASYEIEALCAPGMRLDVAGSAGSGANVQIYTDNNSNAQKWTAQVQADGSFELIPAHATGARLEVLSAGGSGANVRIYTDTNTTAQRWKAEIQFDGNFEIYPVHNTAVRLDVTNGSGASGTNVRVLTDNNSSSQRWTLIKK